MQSSFDAIIGEFGRSAKAKLHNPGATGEPEDQLRAPLERLIRGLAELLNFPTGAVVTIGETSIADLKTRPDFAVTVRNALVGFIEVKAPGKGADPRRFGHRHDQEQWERLQPLPNLVYTDGNAFSLWRSGELVEPIVRLEGDVETSGAALRAPPKLLWLFETFLRWQPVPPRSVKELAALSARLCRLLRAEVTEQLIRGDRALSDLAQDWRKLLFPDAGDAQFADGYAQAVTFGMLMARARQIELKSNLTDVARQLAQTNSLIGTALRLLTEDAENQNTLKTSLGTLIRVLDAVDWPTISRDEPDAWLYFYEEFLGIYDNELRKKTGSYYTPPEVVSTMVRLVDEVLRSPRRFNAAAGLASPAVTVADPAAGTGTFILGVLRRIAQAVRDDEGAGAVTAAISAAVQRIVAFEIQLGPFTVAQLRILAELIELTGAASTAEPRMYVTDTLGDPYVEEEWLPSTYRPIGESRRTANRVKREERITVVLGNPPYKEKAKGLGGWVESGSPEANRKAPLRDWSPPREWGVAAHAKHLRNLYVYFWRWATWKVFDADPEHNTGVVCFITVAGFLNGPGFQRMRDYLRRTADEIWVIDCSPEGHQPDVPTRIFQDVQQPVCILLASRASSATRPSPAAVRYRALPAGRREEKFAALAEVTLDGDGWVDCPADWRAPFLPAATGAWSTYVRLEDLFAYNGSGVMPGRTWVIAPDVESLRRRWERLVRAKSAKKELLFHPHEGGDRSVSRVVRRGLPGYADRPIPIEQERDPVVDPVRYGFRSFDRQWIIPDNRVINRPNPELWAGHSELQVYLTAPTRTSPISGPAITFTCLIPDLDHYKGRGGRVFPLWRDAEATEPNVLPLVLAALTKAFGRKVSGEDVLAYVAAVLAHPAFTARYQADLAQPGLRVPVTADRKLFAQAVTLGRTVIWLHTFGERFVDAGRGRPPGPPRLPAGEAPHVPARGAINGAGPDMPNEVAYDAAKRRLLVGKGWIEPVSRKVWEYSVSGKPVLRQWFSYRKRDRSRPLIGTRRPPSPLGDIQPASWLPDYTTELINVLNVLGWLVKLEPRQARLLDLVCASELLDPAAFARQSTAPPQKPVRGPRHDGDPQLLLIDCA
ncbi:MAG: DNA methyltransferase [Phycisphaerales bacterium]|nr:MAG: DNA methyltransferase [Phycisphaerales bacterium]